MELKDLASLGIVLVIAAVVTSVGSQILGEVKTSDSASTASVSNETLNFVANNTWYSLGQGAVVGSVTVYDDAAQTNSFSSTFFESETGTNARIRIFTNSSVGSYPNMTTGNKYLAYEIYQEAYNITEQGQEGLESLAGYFPTVALVAAAVMVIAVIMGVFGGTRREMM